MATELRNVRLATVAVAPTGTPVLRNVRLAVVAPDPAYFASESAAVVTGGRRHRRVKVF